MPGVLYLTWIATAQTRRQTATTAMDNSIAELPDRSHPARQVIEEHKACQTRRLVGMCAEAQRPEPEQTAAEITFVLEGAQVSTQNGSIDQAGAA